MTDQGAEFDVIEPIFDEAADLRRRIVEAINDGDEIGAEALHDRLIAVETANWEPENKT